MISEAKKAKVLLAVAEGQTLAAAAKANGLSPGRGRDALARICRKLGLACTVDEVRANPDVYRDAARRIIDDPGNALRKDLREKLVRYLKLRSADDLTPHYVSNLTASSMLAAGLTHGAVAELQAWLLASGTRFKRQAPREGEETQAAVRAVLLLDAFGFDVNAARAALGELDSSEREG